MFSIEVKGDYNRTLKHLGKIAHGEYLKNLSKYGEAGVAALASATPVDTGLTAESWSYEVRSSAGRYDVIWKNSHVVDGVPIAVILQYGHGTRNGGYVQGIDYINPALRPVFEQIAEDAWKAVISE